ncbi:type II and III secretion system protein family protein [Gemmobacter caeruleus]|uniref:type II and III secretion system protein family protein n=1 Tax=Gemmobacter caeruleus TaxID=2595004 RepID=UPI00193A7086|nr:type II and III secretion system protein family protein [Gemmobacter caeruleus]
MQLTDPKTGHGGPVKRGGWRLFLALCALGLSLATAPGTARAQERFISLGEGAPVTTITIKPGFTVTLNTNVPYSDVVVGNADVADVFPLTSSSAYVQGNNAGATNVSFYDANKVLMGGLILKVEVDFGELRGAIRSAVPSARVEVDNVNGRIRLSGAVKDGVDLKRVLEIAAQFSTDPVVNAIRVTDPQQVQLEVRILEVSRTSGRELGVNLTGTNDGQRRLTTGGSVSGDTPFGSFVGNLLQIAGTQIDYVINVLEGRGLARRLANPTLVTTSGVEANFVVGGEVPISSAVTGENGTVATETDYREYGVRLNFMPVVLDDGMISLRVRPEVSDIDTSVTVNGQPAFISRKADTTVTLRDGQSFAIAGLLQVDNERNLKQVPWIGQVPILGTLFRSTAFQKKETDLVILVTPRLVRPGAPSEPMVSPLDGARSSNDVELFMLGMLEVNKDMIRGFRSGDGVLGPYGHIIDLEFDDALIKKK